MQRGMILKLSKLPAGACVSDLKDAFANYSVKIANVEILNEDEGLVVFQGEEDEARLVNNIYSSSHPLLVSFLN